MKPAVEGIEDVKGVEDRCLYCADCKFVGALHLVYSCVSKEKSNNTAYGRFTTFQIFGRIDVWQTYLQIKVNNE